MKKTCITFTPETLIPCVLPDGWPEKPSSFDSAHYVSAKNMIEDEYEEAKAAAIASAIPFDEGDRKEAMRVFHDKIDVFSIPPQPNTPYKLDIDYEIRKVKCGECGGNKQMLYEVPFGTSQFKNCESCNGEGEVQRAFLVEGKEESFPTNQNEAWKVWEEDQKTNHSSVNPHAFVYGYNFAKGKYESQLTALREENERLKLENQALKFIIEQ